MASFHIRCLYESVNVKFHLHHIPTWNLGNVFTHTTPPYPLHSLNPPDKDKRTFSLQPVAMIKRRNKTFCLVRDGV